MIDIFKNELLDAGIENAKNEISWFLEKKFDINKKDILLKNFTLNTKQEEIFQNFIIRRKNKEPFQYIINHAPFCGVDLYVDHNVLIPRPETEIIINILKEKKIFFNSALDLCTGAGNLALLLSLNKIAKNITAIDCSRKALDIAKKNFKKHNIHNINCIQLDFLRDKIHSKFDLVVCNPPYISKKEYTNLDIGVKKFEPREALTDNKDGLTFYKKIYEELEHIVYDKSILLLEIGLEKQKPYIEDIFKKQKYKWYKDLNNNYRIIQIYK